MSLHEANKQRNRERILAAADEIIRDQGLESLSMRYLADYAGVSLRTPYNLFSSKTEIIAELLMRSLAQVVGANGADQADDAEAGSGLDQVMGLLDGLRQAAPKLGPARDMFREVMVAPEQAMRDRGIAFAAMLIRPGIEAALAAKQLKPDADVPALTRHLQVLVMAIAGMWAAGQLELLEALEHTEQAWCRALIPVARPASARALEARLAG